MVFNCAKLYFSRLKLSAICGLENCVKPYSPLVENVNLLPLLLVLSDHVALRHLVPTIRPGILSKVGTVNLKCTVSNFWRENRLFYLLLSLQITLLLAISPPWYKTYLVTGGHHSLKCTSRTMTESLKILRFSFWNSRRYSKKCAQSLNGRWLSTENDTSPLTIICMNGTPCDTSLGYSQGVHRNMGGHYRGLNIKRGPSNSPPPPCLFGSKRKNSLALK